MQINPNFIFSGATQVDEAQFENAVNTVIALFDKTFTNVNVTLNIDFAYGLKYLSNTASSVSLQPMANASPTDSFLLGASQTPYESKSYSTLLSQLQTKTDTLQPTAYATLPTAQNNPFANDQLLISTAQEKALGFTPGSSLAGFDGVIGIISNEELQAGGYLADWAKDAPAYGNQYYMIGVIEHELSEVMGRFSYDGTNFNGPSTPSYTLMDMFRYSAPGVHQSTDGNPAYFSIDNGNLAYWYWNTALAKGDLGDWAPSGPNASDPTGNDSFLNISHPGVVNEASVFDLDLMNVLGWNLSTPTTISASTIASEYLAIERTALDPSLATSIADAINAGTKTETGYINSLLFFSQAADTTIPAVAVEGSMYGAVGSSAEVTLLATQFLPAQVNNATSHGFNPLVYASEALGLAFAFGDENGGMAFATNFGPANAAMPNTTAGDAAFAAAACASIFGSASTPNLVNGLDGFVTNWKSFYAGHGIPGIVNATAAQVDLAARGAAWGDMVGVALANNLGPLKGQAINFLDDAAQGTAVYSASLAGQPSHAAFHSEAAIASAAAADANVQLTGVAAHVDHSVM
jgi:hypothetical protein